MFIRNAKWEEVREHFTAHEKSLLRLSVEGSVVCPPGVIINEESLPATLREKIIAVVEGAASGAVDSAE